MPRRDEEKLGVSHTNRNTILDAGLMLAIVRMMMYLFLSCYNESS